MPSDYGVLLAVVKGDRPERPEGNATGLTDEIWEIMQMCWNSAPSQRPLANRIVELLGSAEILASDNRLQDDFNQSVLLETMSQDALGFPDDSRLRGRSPQVIHVLPSPTSTYSSRSSRSLRDRSPHRSRSRSYSRSTRSRSRSPPDRMPPYPPHYPLPHAPHYPLPYPFPYPQPTNINIPTQYPIVLSPDTPSPPSSRRSSRSRSRSPSIQHAPLYLPVNLPPPQIIFPPRTPSPQSSPSSSSSIFPATIPQYPTPLPIPTPSPIPIPLQRLPSISLSQTQTPSPQTATIPHSNSPFIPGISVPSPYQPSSSPGAHSRYSNRSNSRSPLRVKLPEGNSSSIDASGLARYNPSKDLPAIPQDMSASPKDSVWSTQASASSTNEGVRAPWAEDDDDDDDDEGADNIVYDPGRGRRTWNKAPSQEVYTFSDWNRYSPAWISTLYILEPWFWCAIHMQIVPQAHGSLLADSVGLLRRPVWQLAACTRRLLYI